MPSAQRFSRAFYRSIAAGSAIAASSVAPEVNACIRAASVVDFGCGPGAWLQAFRACGSARVLGLDQFDPAGVDLRIAQDEYVRADLTKPIDLGLKFDLALCLEVAEHLPPAATATLVKNLVAASDRIVFSAGVPGQGGVDHVNERPLAEWVEIFSREGYAASDFIRAAIAEKRLAAEPWYRYNTLYFYRRSAGPQPACVEQYAVNDPAMLVHRVAAWWRMRCLLLGFLPASVTTALANGKHNLRSFLNPS